MKQFIQFVVLFCSTSVVAQPIQNFSLTNVKNDKVVSLNNYTSSKGVVVIFTSNDCPFDQYYLQRIIELHEATSATVPVLLINSHAGDEETPSAMKSFANSNSIPMPYLADKDQKVLTQFDAKKSPEAFLLKNVSGKFTIVYRGAIDDNPQVADEAVDTYLKTAITQMMGGEKIEQTEIRPVGCSIRKN